MWDARDTPRSLTRRLYCNECRAWVSADAEHPGDPITTEWSCPDCCSPILCDECGEEWSQEHDEEEHS